MHLIPLLLIVPAMASAAGSTFEVGKIPSSQRDYELSVMRGNRRAASLSRDLGNRSIGNGARHIRHGHHHHHRPEVRMGYMQVAEGVLGLLAAVAGDKLSDVSGNNADHLSDIPTASAQSRVDGAAGSGSLSESKIAERKTAASSFLKENGDLKEAVASLEEEHGITKDAFLNAMARGDSSKDLLLNAPIDPPSSKEVKETYAKLKAQSVDGVVAENLFADNVDASTVNASPSAHTESDAAPAVARSAEDLRNSLSRKLASVGEAEYEVSSEIKDAMAAKARVEQEQAAENAKFEYSIFDVVHVKYKEREKNLRWGDPLPQAMR